MQATHAIPASGIHEEHHSDAGFWSTYVFSTDHKVIGIQYGVTALCFLFFGFLLMLVMRWQIAHPGSPVPLVGSLIHGVVGDQMATAVKDKVTGVLLGYSVTPDLYNSFGAMH